MMGFIYPWICIQAGIDHDPVDEVVQASIIGYDSLSHFRAVIQSTLNALHGRRPIRQPSDAVLGLKSVGSATEKVRTVICIAQDAEQNGPHIY
jgi:hypothetical protein